MTKKVYRECGPGWNKLIDPLIELVGTHAGEILQIKEKFGGLRFYYVGGPDWVNKIVSLVEELSYHVCEECGLPGRPRYGGWIKTLCEKHAEERRRKKGIADGMDEWSAQE